MNDNTQINDNWVPINLQIPMDNKFMDLSDFYIFTKVYDTKDGEPYCSGDYKDYVHDGKDGLVNKSCIDEEKSFLIYVTDLFSFIVKTELNVLWINFIKKDSISGELIDKNNHTDFTKVREAPVHSIKNMIEYIIDPTHKEHFVKSLKDDTACIKYNEMMSKITDMMSHGMDANFAGYDYTVDDKVIDCSKFIIVTMKCTEEKMWFQLHDGLQGLTTLKINDNDKDYRIMVVAEGFLLLSNNVEDDIFTFFIDKNNNMLLETMKLFDIKNSGNSNEIDINKLKLYLIILSMKNGDRFVRVLRFISQPIKQLSNYVIDSKLKEKVLSLNSTASA